MNKITTLALLIGLTVVAAPLIASAQIIEVTPESWDYGDVKVGTGESQIFTIQGFQILTLFYIGIIEDASGAFAMGPVPDVPFTLDDCETVDVEITFTPPNLGAHEAFLYIVHDAHGGETLIPLYGVGVRGWRCFEAKAAP
jgi:hypothetical protein